MKHIGIKYLLRMTTMIPVLVVALLFAVFYNGQFHRDLKQYTLRLGESYIRQLLPAAQWALLREDQRTLQGLTDASTINPEIKSLAFYSAAGQLLAYRGGKHSIKKPFKPPQFTGDYVENKVLSPMSILFTAPITIPKFNLYSYSPFRESSNMIDFQSEDILGWLSIEVDTQPTLFKRYQMYIVTIFITLFGLIISLSIHYFLSKRLYLPIVRLRRSMKQILNNLFETKITATSKGDLGTIEQGIVHLQKQYLNTIKDMNQHIEVATQDLQKNLELLEEQNIELSLDKRKAEDKIHQKSEFIANMSHEIRTPMNGIIGFTNLLMESHLNSLQLDYVKTIHSSGQNLLAIINDILDYSKIEAGKLHLDCIPLDIRACIDEIITLLTPNAHQKGIDLLPATAINVPKTVLGDPLRLKQIISNLLSNAIKFTEHGYVLIRTHIEQETEKFYSINFEVIDTGMGISPQDQVNLFNAFNQGDTTITRRFGGSGLGLVICKKLAEHMHGKISLQSELHKGSTFTVQLQLEKLTAYEIERNQTHRYSHLKVLCFDENPLHLETLCNGLGCLGIQCIPIQHFSELNQAFIEHADAHMAFVSINQGCETAVGDILKQQSIPCVIVSKSAIQDYQALGAQAFLFKPPNIQKLQNTIESLLNPTKLLNHPGKKIDLLREQFKTLNARLLIAEDNPVNRLLFLSFLKNLANCVEVVDGKEAIEIGMKKKFDCMLLDLQMPYFDGLEVAHALSEKIGLNQITPKILISANTTDITQDHLQKAGIAICMQKPIDEEQLITALLKLVIPTKNTAIHWDLCVKKASGNDRLAHEFLEKFIEELEKNKLEFNQLIKDQHVKEIEALAHKLHGACCFCGVPQLQSDVAELESFAKKELEWVMIESATIQVLQSIQAVIQEYQTLERTSIT